MRGIRACVLFVLGVVATDSAWAAGLYQIEWTRQLGSTESDYGKSITTDSAGNCYVTGYTSGSLGGPNAGYDDVFVAKYDAAGNLAWARQLGTSSFDVGYGVATDWAGNLFITGYTDGSLGGSNVGGEDAYIAKYDAAGNLAWTRQLGTSNTDWGLSIATDLAGGIFITGYTDGPLGGPYPSPVDDSFVAKYDTTGNLVWTRQLGTSSFDIGKEIVTDAAGNLFITGYTYGSLGGPNAGGPDAFVAKYDTDGNSVWMRQVGTSDSDWGLGIATDPAGNLFITGYTYGSIGGPNAGERDAFVAKYDPAGDLVWTRQLGTSDTDWSMGIATDLAGNLFITGQTNGSLGGPYPNPGGGDGFVAMYDTTGNLIWTCQFGTRATDWSSDIATDPAGNLFITGDSTGSLGGPNAGATDVFVVKFSVPEPTALLPLGLVGLGMLYRR
jgi:hypothetical protein